MGIPDDSKKYAYIQQQVNNIQSISSGPSNRNDIINKVTVNTDLHALIDNLDEAGPITDNIALELSAKFVFSINI